MGDTSSLRLGIPRAYFYEALHPDIQKALEAALTVLKCLTASQLDVGPLATDETYSEVRDASRTILGAEAYAYHAEYVAKTPDLYQPETLRRIRGGAVIGTAAYVKGRLGLDHVRRSVRRVFDEVDLLVTPTAPVPPPAIAELEADPGALRSTELRTLRNTQPFNVLGLPTLSVPCGITETGLPIGMQITGPTGGEAVVLRLAHAYEQATDWHKRQPAFGSQ